MIYESYYLQHHGIIGQKWGVRRFQNADGTLTAEGKDRYNRGKQYAKEYNEVRNKEHDTLLKNSKKYANAKKEADRIAEKYSLDRDDGGGGDTENYTQEELRRAGDRYWQLNEDMEQISVELSEKARNNAKKYISEKYGDTALSDIDYYETKKSHRIIGAFVALFGAFTLATILPDIVKSKKSKKY